MRAALAAICAAALLAGCRGDRGGAAGGQAQGDSAARPGTVALRLILPRALGWNEQGRVYVEVTNGTAGPLRDAVLNVSVDGPVALLADDSASAAAAAGPVRADSTPEGMRAALPLREVAGGAVVEGAVAVRLPPAGLRRPDGAPDPRDRFLVRAWLTTRGGTPVGQPVQDTLRVRPGSEKVAGGCGDVKDAAVTRNGVGPVRLGMTLDALRAVCPEARDTAWTGQEGMQERGTVVAVAGYPLVAQAVRDTVQRIVIDTAGLRTAAGLGVGSTLGELRSRYGRTCAGEAEGRVAVWFPNAPGTSFALEPEDAVDWLELGTRDPAALPDGARVASLWVRRGSDDCAAGAAGSGER